MSDPGSDPQGAGADQSETPDLNDELAQLANEYQTAMTPTRESYAAFDVATMLPPAPASPAKGADESDEDFVEFDSRMREPFMGLMFIGALSKRFDWAGHTFVIRTLTVDDQLQCSLVSKDYVDTGGANRAWQAAVVACCTVTVDGQPLPVPLDDSKSGFLTRYDWVLRHWFAPVIDVVYEQFLILNFKVQEVLAAMGKATG